MALPELSSFRLVGGTSLALQIGHRTSVDIDLFTDTSFDKKKIQQVFENNFSSFQLLWQNENGMSVVIEDVKVDLFNWRVRFVEPVKVDGALRLMNKKEVAAMKLEAITDRKMKKDFTDVFFLLQYYSLEEMIQTFRTKYTFIDYKFVIESLHAIDEADQSELPVMLQPFDWDMAKAAITFSTNQYIGLLRGKAEASHNERLRKAEELLNQKKKN